ncbi:LamG domain-containing protein [bacterium]|nr:LamG domain-containing protein [bacterium]
MANKPTWKSRDIVEAFVEKQGSNRKLHTIRKQGPAKDAPNLQLGFKSDDGSRTSYYGQGKALKLWITAQKTTAPSDTVGNHTIQEQSGTVSGHILTNKEDTPFTRFVPSPYRSTSRCLVFNTGSSDRQLIHVTSSQYTTLASGSAGLLNKAMSWNVWIKPSFTGSHATSRSRVIFKKASGSNSAEKREYELSIDPYARLKFTLWDESSSKYVIKYTDLAISGSAVQVGVWQNVCVTYSGKTGTYTHQGIKVYRNGNLVSSGNAGTTQTGYVATENSGGDLVIAAENTGSTTEANFYRGKLSEFSMWHTALKEEDVVAIYNARLFQPKMDTSAIDHLRQGVSIRNQKHRWRSSNAPKISGISRLSTSERVSHEQDQTLYGNVKLFRDNTPFEELADAERLRTDINITTVGTKASASLEFRGYPDAYGTASTVPALILTSSDGTKKVFYFTARSTTLTSIAKYNASNFLPVVVSSSLMAAATGAIGQGQLIAEAFTSRVNGYSESLQITARSFGNIVKLTSTVTGTAGRTIISGRSITTNTSTTGSRLATSFDINNNPVLGTFITGTFNTSSVGKSPGSDRTLTFIGGNSTMKQVVTSAVGGAIDYLNDAGHQQYPVIITNVSMKDPAQFDGNIEPLALRETVSWSSIDAPIIAHDIRASFMGGEGSVLFGSSQIKQFYNNKNPVTDNAAIVSINGKSALNGLPIASAAARAVKKETEPFIDAQETIFGLSAKTAYSYIRFTKVPHNGDKIILTDTAGRRVAFEFANTANFATGVIGKTRGRPYTAPGGATISGRGTWRVLLTGSDTSVVTPLSTGSTLTAQVATAMNLFRKDLGLALSSNRLFITCSDRRLTENGLVYSTTSGSRTYVRLDQTISGADGNRRIDLRARGFSTGNYVINNLTASSVYKSLALQFGMSAFFQNPRTAIKFIRQKSLKLGMGFISGSDSFNVPIPGFISEIEKKGDAFSDIMKIEMKKGSGSISSLLTSTMGGTREWNVIGHGYKSSGAGFTYDNDVFGTDSIAFGGKKR